MMPSTPRLLFTGSNWAGSSRYLTRLLLASSLTQPSWRIGPCPPASSIAAIIRRVSGDAPSAAANQGRESRCPSMYLAAASLLMSGSPARLRSKRASSSRGALNGPGSQSPSTRCRYLASASRRLFGSSSTSPGGDFSAFSVSTISRGTSAASTTRVSVSRLSRALIWELCHQSVINSLPSVKAVRTEEARVDVVEFMS
jgi:hypothetical protein